jgi:predicted phosphodiesterase
MLGILADIHGNAWALEAVLVDAERRGVTEFVDLGDVLYGPLAPRRTFELLGKVNIVVHVRGNQDRLILEGPRNPTLDWVRSDLGAEPLAWLAGLPLTARHRDSLLFHGSPSSDTTYLLEDVSGGFARMRNDQDILALLGSIAETRIFCGHTHVPRIVRLSSGQTIINPGSVGVPAYDDDAPVAHVMESFSPHARYVTLDESTVSFHQVEYDWHAAASKARALGRNDWARGIATGRMT